MAYMRHHSAGEYQILQESEQPDPRPHPLWADNLEPVHTLLSRELGTVEKKSNPRKI